MNSNNKEFDINEIFKVINNFKGILENIKKNDILKIMNDIDKKNFFLDMQIVNEVIKKVLISGIKSQSIKKK